MSSEGMETQLCVCVCVCVCLCVCASAALLMGVRRLCLAPSTERLSGAVRCYMVFSTWGLLDTSHACKNKCIHTHTHTHTHTHSHATTLAHRQACNTLIRIYSCHLCFTHALSMYTRHPFILMPRIKPTHTHTHTHTRR